MGVGLFRQQSMTITDTHVLNGNHGRTNEYMLDFFMEMDDSYQNHSEADVNFLSQENICYLIFTKVANSLLVFFTRSYIFVFKIDFWRNERIYGI